MEQQSPQDPLIDKLSISLSDNRTSGNAENQSNIPEFNQIQPNLQNRSGK